jgi:hypothetical protein
LSDFLYRCRADFFAWYNLLKLKEMPAYLAVASGMIIAFVSVCTTLPFCLISHFFLTGRRGEGWVCLFIRIGKIYLKIGR